MREICTVMLGVLLAFSTTAFAAQINTGELPVLLGLNPGDIHSKTSLPADHEDGVNAFHMSADLLMPSYNPGYDLRLFVSGKEWCPTTRSRGFSTWCVPLKKGYYPFRCVFLNYEESLFFTSKTHVSTLHYSKPGSEERLNLKDAVFTKKEM